MGMVSACLVALVAASAALGTGEVQASGTEGLSPTDLLGLVVRDGKLHRSRTYAEGSLAWAGDGSLLYATSARHPGDRVPTITRFDTASGEHRLLANGTFAVVSPDGLRAAIGEGGQLRIVSLDPHDARDPISLEVDLTGSLAQVGGRTVAWSPDSNGLAFVRVNAAARRAGTGTPKTRYASGFELRIHDFASGNTRTLLDSVGVDAGIGSVAWPVGGRLLVSRGAGDSADQLSAQLAWVDAQSGALTPLIEDAAFLASAMRPLVSPDGRWMSYWRDFDYTSPAQLGFGLAIRGLADASDRRVQHVPYAMGFAAWAPDSDRVFFPCKQAALASAICVAAAQSGTLVDVMNLYPLEDIEWLSMAPQGGRLAWRSRDAWDVERIRILELDTGVQTLVREDRRVDPVTTPLSAVRPLTWHSFDGLRIGGLLVEPLGYVPGRRYPVIVDVHGGPNGGIRLSGALLNSTPLEWQMWAAQGYAVLVADYRQGGVYAPGNTYRRRSEHRHLSDEDAADLVSGARYLIDTGLADPQRMFIIGHSAGSAVTNWLITRTGCFAGAVSKEGRTDRRWMAPGWGPFNRFYFNASADALAQVLAQSSPLLHATRVRTPLLYINGQYGLGVEEGEQFVEAINAAGGRAQWVRYADEGHNIEAAANMQDMLHRTLRFLRDTRDTGGVGETRPGGSAACDAASIMADPMPSVTR